MYGFPKPTNHKRLAFYSQIHREVAYSNELERRVDLWERLRSRLLRTITEVMKKIVWKRLLVLYVQRYNSLKIENSRYNLRSHADANMRSFQRIIRLQRNRGLLHTEISCIHVTSKSYTLNCRTTKHRIFQRWSIFISRSYRTICKNSSLATERRHSEKSFESVTVTVGLF